MIEANFEQHLKLIDSWKNSEIKKLQVKIQLLHLANWATFGMENEEATAAEVKLFNLLLRKVQYILSLIED